ncbi:MAG: DUF1353 domain-containing protein [Desulfobacterales bacterium]|jgi:hypothetical protein
MAEGFSGDPITQWTRARNMRLVKAFSYEDPAGVLWEAPEGAEINGATIPRALWTSIGAPYVGNYRRATIVHDYFVGELSNPDVSPTERKAADRMFYHACRHDGCSRKFAGILYIGVCLGTWMAALGEPFHQSVGGDQIEYQRDLPENDFATNKFWQIVDDCEAAIDAGDLEAIDDIISTHING